MKKISCLIADDEPMALSLIESYVHKTPFLELKVKCSSAIEALQKLESIGAVDLFFLDIQMPELSGLDFSKLIPTTSKVVFTTAFEQYAIDGYKVSALDYLLKPFDYSEFLSAANKAKIWFESQIAATGKTESKTDFFFVNSEYKQIKINFSEILFIEGLKDYVKIFIHNNPKAIFTLSSLKKLEDELPSNNFMRIHRSYIIALDKIEAIESNQVIIGPKKIAIAPNYKEALMQYLNGNSLKKSS